VNDALAGFQLAAALAARNVDCKAHDGDPLASDLRPKNHTPDSRTIIQGAEEVASAAWRGTTVVTTTFERIAGGGAAAL
jgi:hypothetical protein